MFEGRKPQPQRAAGAPALALIANGPGEISGWAIPVAREIRARRGPDHLRLVLLLPPTQFAGGHEAQVAEASGLFDELILPWRCLALALGIARLREPIPAALLHLGGDLWITRLLAGRWQASASVYAETDLVAGHRGVFTRIFVPSAVVAERLRARGIPSERLRIVGDPRLDEIPPRGAATRAAGCPRVTLLASSRPRFFGRLFPLWMQTAAHLRRLRPRSEITVAVAPSLPEGIEDEALPGWQETAGALGVVVLRVAAREAIVNTDLVVTIPGTTTMEVSAVPVTALVVVPLQHAVDVPVEGIADLVVHLPWLGPWIKRRFAPLYVARRRFVALPNRLTGRRILPELIGELTPERIAEEAARLLDNPSERRAIEGALAEAAGPRGAAVAIAEEMLAGVVLESRQELLRPRASVGV